MDSIHITEVLKYNEVELNIIYDQGEEHPNDALEDILEVAKNGTNTRSNMGSIIHIPYKYKFVTKYNFSTGQYLTNPNKFFVYWIRYRKENRPSGFLDNSFRVTFLSSIIVDLTKQDTDGNYISELFADMPAGEDLSAYEIQNAVTLTSKALIDASMKTFVVTPPPSTVKNAQLSALIKKDKKSTVKK